MRALSITFQLRSVFVFTCQTLGSHKRKEDAEHLEYSWGSMVLTPLSAMILQQTWLSWRKEFIRDSLLTVIEAREEISDTSTTLLFPRAPLSVKGSRANGLAFRNRPSMTVKLYGI